MTQFKPFDRPSTDSYVAEFVALASRTPGLTSTDSTPSSPVKVLHVINGEHYSGAERVQDLLGMYLPSFGYAPGFACVKPDRFPRQRLAVSAPLHEVAMAHRWSLGSVRRVAEIVEKGDYRILHAHTPRTAMIAAMVARRLRRPFIYHVHSPVGRDSTRRWANLFNLHVERWSLRRATHLITVSHSLARYMIQQGVSEDRVSVVPNGVPVPDVVRESRVPSPPWTIGTVALFRPRKGTEILLRALAQLRDTGRHVKLRAVGPFETPEYQRSLVQLVNELQIGDLVEWTGFTSNVAAELARMDLFVLPSLFGEGLPMVVLEAMASGVPIVASEVEGVPEAIRNETDGILVQPDNPDSLGLGIRRVIDGVIDWSTLRNNARQRHASHFSATAMARGVANVYDSKIFREDP